MSKRTNDDEHSDREPSTAKRRRCFETTRTRSSSAPASQPADFDSADLNEKSPQDLRRLLEINAEEKNQLNIRINNYIIGGTDVDIVLLRRWRDVCVERLRAIRLALGVENTGLADDWDNIEEASSDALWQPEELTSKSPRNKIRRRVQIEHGEVANNIFHHTRIWAAQAEAIDYTLKGQDVFVLQPTGKGKSLMYQLPAVVESTGYPYKITIVISPLLALIHDQVVACRAKGISVLAVTSDEAFQSEARFLRKLQDERPALVYVTPEKIKRENWFYNVLRGLDKMDQLGRFAIDEVHCIFSWGLAFREAYLNLPILREDFPAVPIMALTSTVTPRDLDAICKHLNLVQPKLVRSSLYRENLHITIEHKRLDHPLRPLLAFIQTKHPKETGIIYCNSRTRCKKLAEQLSEEGIRAGFYHAGMSKEDRFMVYQEWMDGRMEVIVATTAFGMGIDKANVRFVVHYDCPKNIESYYQEIGRAGRDGQVADCLLYYRYTDLLLELHPSGPNSTSPRAIAAKKHALAMVRLAENSSSCVMQSLLQYFGEHLPSPCSDCSNCTHASSGSLTTDDFSALARDIITLMRALSMRTPGERITFKQLIDLLLARKNACTRLNSRDTHEGYGAGKRAGVSQDLLEVVLARMIAAGLLAMERSMGIDGGGKHWYLKLGAKPLNSGSFKISYFKTSVMCTSSAVRIPTSRKQLPTAKKSASSSRPKAKAKRHRSIPSSGQEVADDLIVVMATDDEKDDPMEVADSDAFTVLESNLNNNASTRTATSPRRRCHSKAPTHWLSKLLARRKPPARRSRSTSQAVARSKSPGIIVVDASDSDSEEELEKTDSDSDDSDDDDKSESESDSDDDVAVISRTGGPFGAIPSYNSSSSKYERSLIPDRSVPIPEGRYQFADLLCIDYAKDKDKDTGEYKTVVRERLPRGCVFDLKKRAREKGDERPSEEMTMNAFERFLEVRRALE